MFFHLVHYYLIFTLKFNILNAYALTVHYIILQFLKLVISLTVHRFLYSVCRLYQPK